MRTYERSWWWVKQKKQMALVFITVTMILQFQMKGCIGCVETERVGLLQLKSYFNTFRSPQEGRFLESWSHVDPKSDCCKWKRVECTGGHVVNLTLYEVLPRSALNQPLPLNLSLLHSFPQLKTLQLSWNRFGYLFDPIHGHKSFQRLKNLETLDLSSNFFNNSVLLFLSAARSLRTLNLGGNGLKGAFPPNGLINFTELEELDLSSNSINDFEAADGLRMTKLKKLDLSFNEFSDTARLKGLEHLGRLQVLNMELNRFDNTRPIEGLVFPSSLHILNLKDNQLSLTQEGYSKLCGLMNLQELDLSNNALTSMLHCLGNLNRLRTLDLSNNQLSGNLSAFVSGLSSELEYLSLLHNNFNGSFLFTSLVNKPRLTIFKLSSKVGMIQAQAESSWVPLFQLKLLQLNNFSLGSTIPGFLVHQHELYFVDLTHNKLTGAFPTWLVQNNTRLLVVFLNSNSLTELQLPRHVHGLQVLDISSNRVFNSIQEDIGIVFPNMQFMNFSSNHFHGTIPSSMGEMKFLETLDLSSNLLSGQLPKNFLSSCYLLNFLKLSNNKFYGEIFPEHANLTGLEFLLVDGNNFSGSLGKGLLNSKELKVLDMSDNSFSGRLPLWFGRLSSLVILNMRGNQLIGPFPNQLQSFSGTLQFLDMSHNSFSGSIPRNINFPSLTELRLQNNEFMGSIPDSLFKSRILQVLDLRNNNFLALLLNDLGEVSSLLVLLLRNNSLQSHIPENICRLNEVILLDLSHNRFTGVIPTCLGNMSFGAETSGYDIWSLNKVAFSTYIPFSQTWIYSSSVILNDGVDNGFESRAPTTVVEFLTKSRYEAYEGDILHMMYGLDLSSNQLSGEIPVEIGDLHDIRSVNFSNNILRGSIPDSVSKLKSLESLDLSNNKLQGNIPHVLADLNSLGYFNVSSNNLSGEIPFKGHLVTFDKRSYLGNAHLCGLPTNISCNPTRVPEPNASMPAKGEEDGVVLLDLWCSLHLHILGLACVPLHRLTLVPRMVLSRRYLHSSSPMLQAFLFGQLILWVKPRYTIYSLFDESLCLMLFVFCYALIKKIYRNVFA